MSRAKVCGEWSASLSIVMEYADDGDLFQKIVQHKKNGTYFGEPIIWQIFIQVRLFVKHRS